MVHVALPCATPLRIVRESGRRRRHRYRSPTLPPATHELQRADAATVPQSTLSQSTHERCRP